MWNTVIPKSKYSTFGKIRDYMATVAKWPGERPIILNRQNRLVVSCELGELLPFRIAVIELANNMRYRMDGQLSMWLNENGHVRDDAVVSLDIYPGDDLDDARSLYCNFDHTNSSRNASDVAGAYMQGCNSYNAAKPKYMSQLSKGMARASIGGWPARKGLKMPTPAACAKLAMHSKTDKQFGSAYIGFANDSMWMWQLPIVAAARLMWDRAGEDKFYEFFNMLQDATVSGHKHQPASQLFRALVVNKVTGRYAQEIFYACDKCMNAFEADRQVKVVRFSPPTMNGKA